MNSPARTVDWRLLTYVSDLLLCSRCLRHGVRTPILQVISRRHRLRTLCQACREHGRDH